MTRIIDKARMLNIILGKQLLCSWGILENDDDENLFWWVCPGI
jgi:hypothetical protein